MTFGDDVRREARIQRARTDVDYLARLVGMKLLPPHAKRLYGLIRDLQARGKGVILTPPGCLKSTVLSLAMLQDLLGPDPHILFASRADKVVKRTGDHLRACIELIYGPATVKASLKDFKGFKDSSEVFCVPGWDPASRDASWTGATQGANIEGIRATAGYMDDVVDRESTTSTAYRESAKRWLELTYLDRLNKGAPVVAVGSLWHPQDLHMDLLSRGWRTHIFPFARKIMPEGYAQYIAARWHGEEYDLLWPESWEGIDLHELELDKGGAIAWALRYMCDPFNLKNAVFQPDWFRYYETPLGPDLQERLEIHLGIDPATGKSEGGSESAITALGLDKSTGWEYVLENIGGYWNVVALKDQIRSMSDRWHPKKIYIEDVGAQRYIIDDLAVDRLPVYGLETKGLDKKTRIESLCVPIERGALRFHLSQQELIHQLLNFPGGKMMDRMDSLEIAHRSFAAGVDRRVRRLRLGG
jgi:phage terminase large subunit-like protein